jgi:hypothetical protein
MAMAQGGLFPGETFLRDEIYQDPESGFHRGQKRSKAMRARLEMMLLELLQQRAAEGATFPVKRKGKVVQRVYEPLATAEESAAEVAHKKRVQRGQALAAANAARREARGEVGLSATALRKMIREQMKINECSRAERKSGMRGCVTTRDLLATKDRAALENLLELLRGEERIEILE